MERRSSSSGTGITMKRNSKHPLLPIFPEQVGWI